jgi:uncharacterized repeat protein (TIGR01451 family)
LSGRWEYSGAGAAKRTDETKGKFSYKKIVLDADAKTLEIVLTPLPLGSGAADQEYKLTIGQDIKFTKKTDSITFTTDYKGPKEGTVAFLQAGATLRMTLPGQGFGWPSGDHLKGIIENDYADSGRAKGVILTQTGCDPSARTGSETAAKPAAATAAAAQTAKPAASAAAATAQTAKPAAAAATAQATTTTAAPHSLILSYRNEVRICVEATSLVPSGKWSPVNEREVGCTEGQSKPNLTIQVNQADVNNEVWLKYQVIAADGGSRQMRAACFRLSESAVNLSLPSVAANPDREGECNPLAQLTIKVTLPSGRSLDQLNGLDLYAVDQLTQNPFRIFKSPYTYSGARLPETIILNGDADFEDGTWPVAQGGTIDLKLKAKPKTIEVQLQDSEEPPHAVSKGNVTVKVAGHSYSLQASASANGLYQAAKGEIVRGDKMAFAVSAPGYQDYSWDDVPFTGVFPFTIKLQSKTRSVSVKPTVLVQGKATPVLVKVTVKYKGEKGDESHVAQLVPPKTYQATVPASKTDPVTVAVEDGGSGYFLPRTISQPVPSEVPIELQFAKPILSVVYNPNTQLAKMQGPESRETDLKDAVWNLFQSLSKDDEWKGRFAYRYLLSAYERSGQKVVAAAEEDSSVPSDREHRDAVLNQFKFQGLPVPADAEIRDSVKFLSGFSFPDKGKRGVLVYLFGAPAYPVLQDDPTLKVLDKTLGDNHMLAVVASFLPGQPSKKDRLLTTDRHRNLRYLEFGASEESQTYFGHGFADIRSAIKDLLAAAEMPQLTITSEAKAPFTQRQKGAQYSVVVSNAGDAGTTKGAVKITDELPLRMELASIEGHGWKCDPATASCERSDPLEGGKSYDPITVKVNVAKDAFPSETNRVSLTYGGSKSAAVEVPTPVTVLPVLSIASTHAGSFQQGQRGAAYLLKVSNAATAGPTTGPVRVTERLPAGLEMASMDDGGHGWKCDPRDGVCERSDVLKPGASYPDIAVKVNVPSDVPASIINLAIVQHEDQPPNGATDLTEIIHNLQIDLTDKSSFKREQAGTYRIVVSNPAEARATHGTVTATVTADPSAGLAVSDMGGEPDWKCDKTKASCQTDNPLNPGQRYAPITVKFNVAKTATTLMTTQVTVSGGGMSSPLTKSDTVWLDLDPVLSVTLAHKDSFKPGQTGTYQITVKNADGAGSTSGKVTVTEAPPDGLEIVSMDGGPKWNCPPKSNSCDRSDALPAGKSYDPVTVTVSVNKAAPPNLTNRVSVTGGGSAEAKTDDPTVVNKEQ